MSTTATATPTAGPAPDTEAALLRAVMEARHARTIAAGSRPEAVQPGTPAYWEQWAAFYTRQADAAARIKAVFEQALRVLPVNSFASYAADEAAAALRFQEDDYRRTAAEFVAGAVAS